MRILLVEDNESDSLIVREELGSAAPGEVRVDWVRSLEDGIRAAPQGGLDVVLLDLGLPDSTGLEALNRFRSAAPELPVVVLTGADDEELAARAMTCGAQDYLVKGDLSGRLLYRTLRYALDRHRMLRGLEERAEEVDRLYRETRSAREQLEAILQASPGLFLVLTPGDHRIVAASDAYLAATMLEREQALGRSLFDLLPGDPDDPACDGARNIRASLERVAATGVSDPMAVQRYPIRRPGSEGGRFEERFWSPVNAPVLDQDGTVRFLIHRIEDVTDYVRARREGGELPGGWMAGSAEERTEADLFLRAREIQDLNRRLQSSEQRVRGVFEAAATGFTVCTPDGRFTYANPAFCGILGYTREELLALDAYALTHPEDRALSREMDRSLLEGERERFVLECRALGKEGEAVWIRKSVSVVRDASGSPTQIVAVSEDITEQRRARKEKEENERLAWLAGEVARVGGWSVDLGTGVATWSDQVCAIHEVPPGTVLTVEEAIQFYTPESIPIISEEFRRCAEDGVPFDVDLQILTATGRRVWVRAIGEAVRSPDGVIRTVHGGFQDISRQKEAEAALLESEASFHQLAESMPLIVWGATPEGMVDYMTQAMESYSGRSAEDLRGEGWVGLLHPEDVEQTREIWSRAVEEGRDYRSEFRIRRHDGAYRWHLVEARPVRAPDGSVRRWYGSATDIHDRRKAAEEARRLAERLTDTLESITEAFFLLDSEGRFLFVNSVGEELAGKSVGSLLGARYWDAFPELVGSPVEGALQDAMRTTRPVDVEYRSDRGAWVHVRAYPTAEGLALYARDITAERSAALELQAMQARFRAVARVTSDVIWDWDVAADTCWRSEGVLDSFAIEPGSLGSSLASWTDRIHPDDRDRVAEGLRRAVEEGGESWSDQYRFLRGDETYAWVEDRGMVLRDGEGRTLRMIGGITDATARVEAQRRIQEQAELLDLAQDAILVRDLDGKLEFWNAGAERIYGWTREEALGRSVEELLYADPTPFREGMARCLAEGTWTAEVDQFRKDGSTVAVEARWTLVRDDKGTPRRILSINTDITERRKLVAQFLRAQRMESIGTLAGGIAHDLNNVLSPILMSIGLLKMEGRVAPGSEEILATVEASARRGADMVKQVLTFARGVEGARVSVNLKRCLEDLGRVVRDTFPRDISFREELPEQLWRLWGDPTQVHQVLLNLAVNARDAMPEGGVLTIAAENVRLDESYAAMNPVASPGRYVRISVSDTGTGMSPEVVEQIFDPFFTTKELGKGTGLGLSTAQAILRSHGGFISVYSEPGNGTEFRAYFPADRATSLEEEENGGAATPLRGDNELVLVVDDEAAVRDITRQTLEAFGYRVITASDGAEAVAIVGRRPGEIDVVLTDFMMPILDGPSTIRALRHMDPNLRIVAASGLGGNGAVAKAADAGARHFIPKPYTAETLLTAVNRALRGD